MKKSETEELCDSLSFLSVLRITKAARFLCAPHVFRERIETHVVFSWGNVSRKACSVLMGKRLEKHM